MPVFDEQYVIDKFEDHVGAFMEVEVIAPPFWFSGSDAHGAIGISEVSFIEEEDRVLNVQICPELIVKQASFMDIKEFEAYITYLIVHVMLHQVFYWVDENQQEETVNSTIKEILPWFYIHIARAVEEKNAERGLPGPLGA